MSFSSHNLLFLIAFSILFLYSPSTNAQAPYSSPPAETPSSSSPEQPPSSSPPAETPSSSPPEQPPSSSPPAETPSSSPPEQPPSSSPPVETPSSSPPAQAPAPSKPKHPHSSPSSIDLVTQVCSRSQNATLCSRLLSKEHGKGLKDLGDTLLEVAHNFTADAYLRILSLYNEQPIPALKDRVGACVQDYVRVSTYLDYWKKTLKANAFNNLPYQVNAVIARVEDCASKFPSPIEQNEIRADTKFLSQVASSLLVISKALGEGRI